VVASRTRTVHIRVTEEVLMATAAKPVPQGYHTVTAQLTLDNAAQTIDWYKRALGAEEVSRSLGPDGKVMHAEIKIGDSRIMLNDVMQGSKGPKAYGGSPASLWLYVENSDQLFNRAVAEGGSVQMPMADQFWGDRAGAIADPNGYTWWIATHKEDFTPEEMKQRSEEFFKQMATSR
jgi:PhnB protein